MNILAIDTSTKIFTLAVARDGKILKEKNIRLTSVLSSSIMPAINRILTASGVGVKKIDALAVGLGPGSFTSLRVGLATVKGLALGCEKPIAGIASLDVVARNLMDTPVDQIAVISDARRGLVYACLYKKTKDRLIRKIGYLLVNIFEFLDRIKGPVIFTGDGIALWGDDINRCAGAGKKFRPSFAPTKDWAPRAGNLIPPALEKLRHGRGDDPDRLVPLYLYPKECQVKRA